jgi:PEP-CTERM motif
MCPVLSLANRAFLAVLGTLLAFTSLPAQAEEFQFDLSGTAFTPGNGYYPGVGPIDISFILDTSQSASSFVFGNSCLQHFQGGAAVSNYNVQLNGQSMLSMPQTGAGFYGDNANGSCNAVFFTAFGLPSFLWEVDPNPGISKSALLASTDPLATLFTNFQSYPGYGEFAGLNVDISRVTVRDPVSVPEPGTLGLLMLGFAGVVVCGRKRISVSAPD